MKIINKLEFLKPKKYQDREKCRKATVRGGPQTCVFDAAVFPGRAVSSHDASDVAELSLGSDG